MVCDGDVTGGVSIVLEQLEADVDDDEDDPDADHPGDDVRSEFENQSESYLVVWIVGPHPGEGDGEDNRHQDDENYQGLSQSFHLHFLVLHN